MIADIPASHHHRQPRSRSPPTNSCVLSVMNEPPDYQPLLFYTAGPRRGEQEPFPAPTQEVGGSSRVMGVKGGGLGA
jgi:hypothetical protein